MRCENVRASERVSPIYTIKLSMFTRCGKGLAATARITVLNKWFLLLFAFEFLPLLSTAASLSQFAHSVFGVQPNKNDLCVSLYRSQCSRHSAFGIMCKFTNKLFAISALLLISTHSTCGSPLGSLFDYLDDSNGYDDVNKGDYDLRYDQRQNGTENVRLNVDGVLIAIPSSSSSSSSSSTSSFTNIATDLLLSTLLGTDYDDKSADIAAEDSPNAPASDVKNQKEPIQTEKDGQKKVESLKDVSIDAKKGETEVVLLRNNAKVSAAADEEEVPKKIHLRRRNK